MMQRYALMPRLLTSERERRGHWDLYLAQNLTPDPGDTSHRLVRGDHLPPASPLPSLLFPSCVTRGHGGRYLDPTPYRVIHTCASLHSYDLLMTNQRSAQLALRRVLPEDRKGRSSGMAELELTDSSQMLAEAWDHESRSEDNLNPGVALAVRAPRHPTRALFAHDLHVTSKV